MNRKNNMVWGTLVAALLASCVDTEIADVTVAKPESIAQYEYLNDYAPLKSYIDRAANPDFKLGLALAANEFIEGGLVFRLAEANFDEVTAGNAMKYASCVNDKGEMNFETVDKFVTAAQAAGITIYGHTLAWHAQQNNKYLNSLIKDKELPPAVGEGNCLHINTPEAKANPWDWQNIYDLESSLLQGKTYVFSMKTKASSAVTFPLWIETPNAGNTHYGIPQISAGTTWSTISIEFTPNSDCSRLLFSFGQFGGDLWFDDMVLVEKGSEQNMIKNGTFEEGSLPSNWSKPSWHAHSYSIIPTPGDAAVMIPVSVASYDFQNGTPLPGWGDGMTLKVEDGVFVIETSNPTDSWKKQICHETKVPFENGQTYSVSLKIKGTVAGNIGLAFQNPDPDKGYPNCGNFPDIPITTEWKEITVKTTCNGEEALRLIWSVGAYGGTIFMDDIDIFYEKSASSIPLTPEEKKEALTLAMNNWIEGMMKATGGYVTTWDVVNEAISGGGNDGEGFYVLESASNAGANAANNFYWQDYLGSEDYARIVVAAARKYYAENGGVKPLKLFINDYNLEYDNHKAKSLVHWIEKWESDGVTKIDGIGTQMHVTYRANAADQQKQEERVVNMFEILAKSGKLVKVSELDMGYVDESGTAVLTKDMTEEQHKAMAEYYKFIVKKYFEIIPVAQQYGITQWCATDAPGAPGDSNWRGGEPVGLWDSNYNRKHTYAGFADGLAGK
ncbi:MULTISPECIES: endo-1,4-beta-xylanase [Bacteroides]|uniref:endo-1,4-beta-xylanase n=1 Tax=Bacteroides TaxID=816 RepID=UPI001F56B943|nr:MULTISPECIES: endo-1,4-beta-xylanase [Bacteroides]MCR1999204.1 endo-1,4-beta-xylanase [Bacteroides acidifaciens]MCX4294567.1 endo-1,4-beta-xylanase [Prevotella sp.]